MCFFFTNAISVPLVWLVILLKNTVFASANFFYKNVGFALTYRCKLFLNKDWMFALHSRCSFQTIDARITQSHTRALIHYTN